MGEERCRPTFQSHRVEGRGLVERNGRDTIADLDVETVLHVRRDVEEVVMVGESPAFRELR